MRRWRGRLSVDCCLPRLRRSCSCPRPIDCCGRIEGRGLNWRNPALQTEQLEQPERKVNHDDNHHVPVKSSPETGRNVLIGVAGLAVLLCVGFAWRHHHNAQASTDLEGQAKEASEAPALVDVVRAGYSERTSDLEL